jgi:Domain of unknown function (DUF4476)
MRMKKFAIVLVMVAAATGAQAQSKLKVFLTEKTPITIEVDGRHFDKTGTSITVGDLPPGKHYLRVFEMQRSRFGRPQEEVIYEGHVKTHPGNITLFELDAPSGNINVYDENLETYSSSPTIINPEENGQGARPYRGIPQPRYHNDGGDQQAQPETGMQPANNVQNTPPAAESTVTDARMAELKSKIAENGTDSKKLNDLKAALANDKLTTNQVSVMMDWLSFESSKVDFVEWAFPKTIDQQNFGSIELKFSYKDYQDEVDDFIKKH